MIKNQQEARKNNSYISMPYVIYHFAMLIFSLIGVSTTIMMVAEALFISLGYNIGKCNATSSSGIYENATSHNICCIRLANNRIDLSYRHEDNFF